MSRWSLPFSFRTRLLLLIVLALLPALALILFEGARDRDNALEQAQRETALLTTTVNQSVSNTVVSGEQLLQTLGSLPEVQSGNESSCAAALSQLPPDLTQPYAQLYAAAPDGTLICTAPLLPPPADIRNLRTFRAAVDTGQVAISDYLIDEATDKPIISMNLPVLGVGGSTIAVLGLAFDLDFLNATSSLAGLPVKSTFIVTDGNGTVLARVPGTDDDIGQPLPAGSSVTRCCPAHRLDGGRRRRWRRAPLRLFAHVLAGRAPAVRHRRPAHLGRVRRCERSPRPEPIGLGVVSILALGAWWLLGNVFFMRRIQALVGATRDVAERPPRRPPAGRRAGRVRRPRPLLQRHDGPARSRSRRPPRARIGVPRDLRARPGRPRPEPPTRASSWP